jgi:hypothetical protein
MRANWEKKCRKYKKLIELCFICCGMQNRMQISNNSSLAGTAAKRKFMPMLQLMTDRYRLPCHIPDRWS